MAAVPGIHVVEEFEKAFQACLSSITNQDNFNVRDSDEIRTSVDLTIQRYLDVAKQMDCFFLQKRLLLSVQKPEHLLVESITELTHEIVRKDALIEKYNEKIQTWQNLLQQEIPGTPRPTPTPQQQQVPVPPPQGMSPGMQPPQMQGPPQPQMPQQGPPQMPPGPHHMMHPAMMNQMGGMPGQPMPQHMTGQPGTQLQGPLAYLERTMSNIGMPDGSGR